MVRAQMSLELGKGHLDRIQVCRYVAPSAADQWRGILQALDDGSGVSAYGCFSERHIWIKKPPWLGTIRAYTGPSSSI